MSHSEMSGSEMPRRKMIDRKHGRRHARFGFVSLGVVLALLGVPVPALAQATDPANEATSRALFDEGRRLMQSGDYAHACTKFEEGQRLAPGIGLKFNLAECYEKLGKVASAWSAYRDVVGLARAQGQELRETIATEKARAIEARVPRLRIVVPDGNRVDKLTVTRDGGVVGAPQWGLALPIDPGTHKITFEAPGFEAETLEVTLAEGKTESVEAPPLRKKTVVERPAVVDAPATKSTTSDGRTQRMIGYVAGGAGIAGLGVGGVFGVFAMDKQKESEAHCVGDRCDVEGLFLRDRALGRATVSTVGFVAGAALLVTGVVLVLTAPRGPEKAKAASTNGPFGLDLRPTPAGIAF
jgi:hypothetical protein